MQVEMIKWLPYPENKPEKNDTYYSVTICINGNKYAYLLYWTGLTWVDYGRYESIDNVNDKVIAFAEKPKPYDPEAKQFNLWTALELMKSGVVCKRAYKNSPHMRIINKFNIEVFQYRHYVTKDDIRWNDTSVTLNDINSLWGRADAD